MAAKRKFSRNSELASIHIKAGQLGMDTKDPSLESDYHTMLWTIARVHSASKLDWTGRKRVIEHLDKCGAGRNANHNEWEFVAQAREDRVGRLRYIIVLAGKIGIKRGRQKRYVEGIAENMDTPIRIFKDGQLAGERTNAVRKPLEFCTADELGDIVNALEKQLHRVERKAAK